MIETPPNTLAEFVTGPGWPAGLAATFRYRLRDNQGSDVIAATGGIVEDLPGLYRGTFTSPAAAGQYTLVVSDDGSFAAGHMATEDVVVASVPVPASPPAPPLAFPSATYATVDDVKSRAGRLRDAFGQSNAPGDAEISGFIDDVAGEIDARLASFGITTVDQTAAAALRGVNADGATAVALSAAFPSDQARRSSGADELIAFYQRRYESAMTAIMNKTHAAVVYLLNLTAGGESASSTFWIEEPDYGLLGSPSSLTDLWEPVGLKPSAYRGMKF